MLPGLLLRGCHLLFKIFHQTAQTSDSSKFHQLAHHNAEFIYLFTIFHLKFTTVSRSVLLRVPPLLKFLSLPSSLTPLLLLSLALLLPPFPLPPSSARFLSSLSLAPSMPRSVPSSLVPLLTLPQLPIPLSHIIASSLRRAPYSLHSPSLLPCPELHWVLCRAQPYVALRQWCVRGSSRCCRCYLISERAPTTNPFFMKSKKSDDRHVQRIRHKHSRCPYLAVGVSGDSDSLLELQPTWYKGRGLLSYNIDAFL